MHFAFVSTIFAVCLPANLNIIPQSGSGGRKIAVGDSKQQPHITQTELDRKLRRKGGVSCQKWFPPIKNKQKQFLSKF